MRYFLRSAWPLAALCLMAGICAFGQEPASNTSSGGWRRFDPSTEPQSDGGAQSAPAPAPQQATGSMPPQITIPAGTWISVRVNEPLSSKHNRAGDSYSATLAAPLVAGGYVIARRGQTLAGRVAQSDEGGRVKGVSHLALELTDLSLVDGQQVPVRTEMARFEAGTSRGRDAAAIGVTTGTGAAIGAAAAGGVGAAAGAGAGAVASVIGVLVTRGRETIVFPEDRLTFRTTEPITISTERSAQAFEPVRQSDYDQQRPVLQRRVAAAPYPYPYPYYGPYWYGPGFYGPVVYGRFGRRW